MSWHCKVLSATVVLLLLSSITGLSQTTSPRYTFLGEAQVRRVEGPNLVKLRLLADGRLVTVRLLGVGSPRNRDRIKHLGPEIRSYIERSHVWDAATAFVRSTLKGRTVRIWARSWDRYDEKNRILAYLVVPSNSGELVDLNGDIIKRGLGFVTRDYVHVTFVRYRELEEEARRSHRGMWQGLSMGRVSSLAK
jgi:endonuclease YncB( thermonuclease family)